ncbi:MAG: hypothetical protein HYX92_07585 [Chloroflexi bacterium]|nr:hypothetical protein [Chloroflexota bacterium]
MKPDKALAVASCITILVVSVLSCTGVPATPAATPKPARPLASPPGSAAATSTPLSPKSSAPATTAPVATPKPNIGEPKYGGSVTRLRERYPDMLDPHLSRGDASWTDVLGPVYSSLLMFNENMEIVPDLVEKWEQPSDLQYVLHLRKGAKFHDNPAMKAREFTADDVKYNIERMGTNDPKFFRRYQFQVVSTIEIQDKYTVRVTLKEPTPPFVSFIAQPHNYIVGREAVERFGDLSRQEAGTGPFYLKSWTEKVSYKLAKNPDYFVKGVPYLDEVNVVIVPDPAARLASFRSGRADFILTSHTDLNALKRTNPKVTSSSLPSFSIVMVFHPDKKPVSDQRVRQALSLALDRQALIEIIMDGQAEIIGAVYGVAESWQLPQEELKRLYKPDIPRAQKLMTEAGYPNGFPLEVKVSSGRKDAMETVTVVAGQLRQMGVDIKQQILEHTTLIAQRNAADYVTLLHANTASIEPGEAIEQRWRAGGMYNLKDEELTRLIDEQRSEVDAAKRRQMLNQFERIMIDKAYVLFLYGYGEHLVRQSYIKGPGQPSVLGQHLVAYNWIEK